MSGFFAIRDLPPSGARIITDETNEISFSFEGVTCTVDNTDGSFTIRTDTSMRIYGLSMGIVRTGFIDKHGRYSFNKKDRWTSDYRNYAEQSDGDVKYYDNSRYFENNIATLLRQRKVYIRV
jgi:hypothetical protein